ncbi:integral membrane protein DGCR2/IDD-like [Bacillus rossius redtenbacheri]|uniref:integral membrane protein DGCR2/IDD-like n=1 Tax=Bacillus rossius redtenbacheri TaxID=93214 RepID=UPI002FDCB2B7
MCCRILVIGISYSLISFSGVACLSSGECVDLNGRTISHGLHYVPGPDTCTLCVCDNGYPKWCKAVLCSPPQDCKSFRVGNSCCEFICLDDTLSKTSPEGGAGEGGTDLGLRLIASTVTAVLSLSLLFFLIHRLRQRKKRGRQNRQLSEDERSLGSIGYIAGSLTYLPGSMGYLGSVGQEHHLEFAYEETPSQFPLWKPPGNYFPHGEAPPPYEEAVAAARAEAALVAANNNNNNTVVLSNNNAGHSSLAGHRTIPINLATSGSFRVEPSAPAVPAAESRRSSRVVEVPPTPPPAEGEGAVAAIRSDAYYEDAVVGLPTALSPTESSGPAPDDCDDYRSECENCKSTRGSCYYLERDAPPETMTLHRRPQDHEDEPSYYRTSLTLPTHARRLRAAPSRGAPTASLHGARENWFSSMPASSTSSTSSEEE